MFPDVDDAEGLYAETKRISSTGFVVRLPFIPNRFL
jgi:hypothetical protein